VISTHEARFPLSVRGVSLTSVGFPPSHQTTTPEEKDSHMKIVPSLKTFRLLFIAFLAVALTGGIAVVKASPAAALTAGFSPGDSAISLTVSAAHPSRFGSNPTGSPMYVRGTGLLPGSTLTLTVKAYGITAEGELGELFKTGSYSQVVTPDGKAYPSISFPDTTKNGGRELIYEVRLEAEFFSGDACEKKTARNITGAKGSITKYMGATVGGVAIPDTYVPADAHLVECTYTPPIYGKNAPSAQTGILSGGSVGGAEEKDISIPVSTCTALMRSNFEC